MSKPHRKRSRVIEQGRHRLTPIERAVCRAQWTRLEREILSTLEGTPCRSLAHGIGDLVAPAHNIAETLEGAEELLQLLDDAMGALNDLAEAGYLWSEESAPLLAQAGDVAVQIMLGSEIRDIAVAQAKFKADVAKAGAAPESA